MSFKEGLRGIEKISIAAVGTLGIGLGASGYTAYKAIEAHQFVTPILRAEDKLILAQEDLGRPSGSIDCEREAGCIIQPEKDPNRQDAISNLESSLQQLQQRPKTNIAEQINRVLLELREKEDSSSESYFSENRQDIKAAAAQLRTNPAFTNKRQSRENNFLTAFAAGLSTLYGSILLVGIRNIKRA